MDHGPQSMDDGLSSIEIAMPFKFEKLEIWQLAMEYADLAYKIADDLLHQEEFNLKSQLRRAATSIALNIAEGSTGLSDTEQARFLGYALRSLLETVAGQQTLKPRSEHLREASTHYDVVDDILNDDTHRQTRNYHP